MHSFTSNWKIASGSFDDSVSFESSESPIDVDGIDFVKKPPLVLTPSESDSSPCEITLTFMQKHEIRQVYVRSTTLVEDDLLHESNHVEAAIESTKESDRDYNEKKSPSSATEEDWVECRVCLTNEVDIVIIPCGHVLCRRCSSAITQCPFCRLQVSKTVKIYRP
ncbi:hypothetical protein POM88_045158 [Heracleum sosnowskyi]|uniref:RING-type domain-containing protein n=1 Tax=Heracleum sosnowskyi TaxID=360622 RepID=A0AAD8H589_9APIA|nr:hypothetical protein POM88_045158 [Heracleum sosnowskyi]